jgi:hypothetical protein
VSGSPEGNQVGGSRWLNDGKYSGAVVVKGAEEEKGSLHGGCSFYSRWRRLAKAARAAGGAVAAAKPWVWQSSGDHGPNTVGTGGTVVQTGRLMGGP